MKKAARVVTPYSAVQETGENVPALKHFFRCLETSGTTMRDSKGGIVWDVSVSGGSGATAYGGHSLVFNGTEKSILTTLADSVSSSVASNPIPTSSGTWATLSSSKVQLAMAVGIVDSTYSQYVRTAIGDTNGILYAGRNGVGMAGAPHHSSWFDGTDNLGQLRTVTPLTNHPIVVPGDLEPETIDTATLNGAAVVQASLAINSESQNFYYVRDISTWAIKTGALGRTLATNYAEMVDPLVYPAGYSWASGLTPEPCMRFSGMRYQGYALFEFNAVPADLEVAMKWMAAEWSNGNRYIYPGWVGKT